MVFQSMKKAQAILFVLLIIAISIFIVGCQEGQKAKGEKLISNDEDTFTKIKREGVLRVGYILAVPWCVRNLENGEMSGTFVEAIQEIARSMEVKVEFVEADFATFIAGLQSKKYDLSISPTFSTIQRAKSVAFTLPLMAAGNSAIVRKGDHRFKTLNDIDNKGVVVAVTQGEQGHEYAKTHFKNAEVKVFSGGDQNLTFSEVLAGRADVALGDAWFSAKFAAEHPTASDLFANDPYNITAVGWAVRYDDMSLLVFINTAIEYLITSGKLDDIYKRYNVKWLVPKKMWGKS